MGRKNLRTCQKGVTTVEFAIVGSVVLLVLFAVIEVGRLLYTWSMLNEASRMAARLATVCQVKHVLGEEATVSQAVVNRWGGMLPGFTEDNLSFSYLDGLGNAAIPPESARYVKSEIVQYQYQMILPFSLDQTLWAPDFATTLRTESMGRTRPSATNPSGEINCTEDGGATI